MPKQTNKISLTRSAVIQRINRKLSANNERLRVTRNDERLLREVGQFYIRTDAILTASLSSLWAANRRAVSSGSDSLDVAPVLTGAEGVNRRNVDLEALARKLDVLRPWETILDDG